MAPVYLRMMAGCQGVCFNHLGFQSVIYNPHINLGLIGNIQSIPAENVNDVVGFFSGLLQCFIYID